ncbi:hypothetical protein BOTBODRAFT_541874 [Botryobasidium botryosum FD-172 SS1]|uniref:Uncharacterized protein n=1 Tax=Botryobasidium botryosum (strain FD-172 SS1) TaxID=930990 RepID=A0A067N166_BOTB1|nr:hypothetical protein BOTBODRAFT_541874 [Botryobasidium botryosum FD-172 SS1]
MTISWFSTARNHPYSFDQLYTSPSSDFGLPFDIASTAHKYGFENIKAWAAGLVTNKIERKEYPSLRSLLPVLDHALRADRASLRDQVCELVRQDLVSDRLEYTRLYAFAEGKSMMSEEGLSSCFISLPLKG